MPHKFDPRSERLDGEERRKLVASMYSVLSAGAGAIGGRYRFAGRASAVPLSRNSQGEGLCADIADEMLERLRRRCATTRSATRDH